MSYAGLEHFSRYFSLSRAYFDCHAPLDASPPAPIHWSPPPVGVAAGRRYGPSFVTKCQLPETEYASSKNTPGAPIAPRSGLLRDAAPFRRAAFLSSAQPRRRLVGVTRQAHGMVAAAAAARRASRPARGCCKPSICTWSFFGRH